jgi:SAM-dependent methyltransferase
MSEALTRERAHQDEWYARAIATHFFEHEGFRQLIAWNLGHLRRVVPLTSSSRVLSLGCGTGEYELALAPSVAQVAAIDLSPVAIVEARRRASDRHITNIDFIEASLLDLSLPPGSFDVVYALGVLHHLSLAERHALLIHVRRWLAAGGWFYARDPNARGLLRLVAGWWVARSTYHSPNEAALDPHELRQELVAAGFQDPQIGYTDVLGGPLPWLVHASSPWLWSAVFRFDQLWLATPGLRRGASQFQIWASL